MGAQGLVIRALEAGDIAAAAKTFVAMGWPDRTATLERYLAEQEAGEPPMFVAFLDGAFAGYVTVSWRSSYEHFAANGTPEIKDLNVITPFRRQGIATALVTAAEHFVATRARVVGIGVGVYRDYGPAQQMYVKLGYLPDGHGLAWRDRSVAPMDRLTVDDDLVLFLTKSLR